MFRKSKKRKPALNGQLVFTKETNQPPSWPGNELSERKQLHRDTKGWKERAYMCWLCDLTNSDINKYLYLI